MANEMRADEESPGVDPGPGPLPETTKATEYPSGWVVYDPENPTAWLQLLDTDPWEVPR